MNEYLARFTTVAHVNEEIALLRNNYDGSVGTILEFHTVVRGLLARRQILMGI